MVSLAFPKKRHSLPVLVVVAVLKIFGWLALCVGSIVLCTFLTVFGVVGGYRLAMAALG